MIPDLTANNPFALLTFIAAPALLTNATSVFALSTANRFLRAGERLRTVAEELEKATEPEDRAWRLVHMNRIERQAVLLLQALRWVYVAMGSFVSGSLIAIFGGAVASQNWHPADTVLMALGLLVGVLGASSVVLGCTLLFRATRLSMQNISEEATVMRKRFAQRDAREGAK